MTSGRLVSSQWISALRAEGIAVSRHMTVDVTRGPLPLSALVRSTYPMRKNQLLSVIPDESLCNLNCLVDRDEYTLLPQPADFLGACCGGSADDTENSVVANELDVWYLAHFLSLTMFLQAQCWFSFLLAEILANVAAMERGITEASSDLAAVLTLRRKADFVTAPTDVMISALFYARHCRFYATSDSAPKHITTVCPLLDLLHLSGGEGSSNLRIERLSVTEDVREEIQESRLLGWKQHRANRDKEEEAFLWCVRAAKDVAANEFLCLPKAAL